MKKPIIYILLITLFTITIYSLKMYLSHDNTIDITNQTEFGENTEIKAEIEIFNGCGEPGVANLYSNFLIDKGYDVIDRKNADSFDYLSTNIIVHKKEKMGIAENLADILKIENIKLVEGGMWDLSLIIGKDFKELDSFEIVQKYYSLF